MSIYNTIITNEANQNSKNSFTLNQYSPYYNPYGIVIKGKSFKLNDIFFYDDNGISLHTGNGWLGNRNEFPSITFKTKKAISRKIKIDFSIKAPFIIKSDDSFDVNYDLYIYIPDLPKFEISYHKTTLGIIKSADFGLLNTNARHNFVEQHAKFFNKISNAEENLREAINKIDIYNLRGTTDEKFNSDIENIINLRKKLIEAIEFEKNYTVEDYLKEENTANT